MSVTVPFSGDPPITVVAASVKLSIVGKPTVIESSIDDAGARATILMATGSVTDLVVTLKVALVAPAGIVTVSGTLAMFDSVDSLIRTPSFGATPFKVSVPVEVLPPTTLVEGKVKDVRMGGVSVRIAGTCAPVAKALTVASSFAPTGTVVKVMDPTVPPAPIMMESGPPHAVVVDEK